MLIMEAASERLGKEFVQRKLDFWVIFGVDLEVKTGEIDMLY